MPPSEMLIGSAAFKDPAPRNARPPVLDQVIPRSNSHRAPFAGRTRWRKPSPSLETITIAASDTPLLSLRDVASADNASVADSDAPPTSILVPWAAPKRNAGPSLGFGRFALKLPA